MTGDRVLFTGIAQLVTAPGAGAVRGAAMRNLDILANVAMSARDGQIEWIGGADDWHGGPCETIDLGGRAVVPALIDPHTHAIWAGDRLADFEARAAGTPYEEILRQGGGIRSSIAATAATDSATLATLAEPRMRALVASGAGTIEIKSGYGFSSEAELASLHAIHLLTQRTPATVIPTLLIHVPPRANAERADYLDAVTGSLIPDVGWQRLAQAVDVFIEKEAFTVAEARQVFLAARKAGMPVKAHADQFHAIGGTELALEFAALSVDHLEASGPDQVRALAASDTVAVVLPGVTLHLGLPPAPARALIDAGAAVATATDLNPGSSPIYSVQLAMALAVRLNRLAPAEALVAATANAAAALGIRHSGRLAPGLRADFLVLHDRDWRDIAYTLGGSPVERVFLGGHEVQP